MKVSWIPVVDIYTLAKSKAAQKNRNTCENLQNHGNLVIPPEVAEVALTRFDQIP